MAYTQKMTAALSGATMSQLQHWRKRHDDRPPLLVPEVSPARLIQYSFRDIVALRTFVRLRKGISLQRIRRALDGLRATGERKHLSAYTLVTDGAAILLLEPDEAVELTGESGQGVFPLSEMLESFETEGVVIPDLLRPRDHLVVDPDVRSGQPIIEGTRVPYDLVAGLVADGVPPSSIAEYYPSVDAESAVDAADFALYVESYGHRRTAA